MARTPLLALGILEALFPAQITDWYENLAYEDADALVRKEWLLSVVRAEGVVLGLLSLLGGRGYVWLLNLMGFVGAIAACFPRQYVGFATKLAYENPEEIESTDQFLRMVRGLGVLYVLTCLKAWNRRRGAE